MNSKPWNFHVMPFFFRSKRPPFYRLCCVYSSNMHKCVIYVAFRVVQCVNMHFVARVFSIKRMAENSARFSVLTTRCAYAGFALVIVKDNKASGAHTRHTPRKAPVHLRICRDWRIFAFDLPFSSYTNVKSSVGKGPQPLNVPQRTP